MRRHCGVKLSSQMVSFHFDFRMGTWPGEAQPIPPAKMPSRDTGDRFSAQQTEAASQPQTSRPILEEMFFVLITRCSVGRILGCARIVLPLINFCGLECFWREMNSRVRVIQNLLGRASVDLNWLVYPSTLTQKAATKTRSVRRPRSSVLPSSLRQSVSAPSNQLASFYFLMWWNQLWARLMLKILQ